LDIPVEIRPDIGAALAADPADEARLDVRKPDVIRPGVTPLRRMAAKVIFTGRSVITHDSAAL
jgi:hypothetical protein